MSESTKRAWRTAFQVVLAIITFVPIVILALPGDLQATPAVIAFGAWVAVVTKIYNALEAKGVIPAWLKSAPAIEGSDAS